MNQTRFHSIHYFLLFFISTPRTLASLFSIGMCEEPKKLENFDIFEIFPWNRAPQKKNEVFFV